MDNDMNEGAKEILETLKRTPAEALVTDNGTNWEVVRKRVGFQIARPDAPSKPDAPVEPVIPAPPNEEDAKYQVELTMMDKMLSSRRIKKQQAALDRFERDRKAWNENRLNALGHFELKKKKYTQHVEALDAEHLEALEQWKRDFERFLEQGAS